MRAWRAWRRLDASERRLLLCLAWLQPLIALALRTAGFKRTRALLERRSKKEPPFHPATPGQHQAAERCARLAAIAGRRSPLPTRCLPQALAVYTLLRRSGLDPELRLGVDRIGSRPDMHAWVELDGVPLAQPHLRHRAFQPGRSASTAATTSSNNS